MTRITRRRPLGWFTGPICALLLLPTGSAAQEVEVLIGQLGSSSATERATAACQLGRMRTSDIALAREELLALLTDGTQVEGRLCWEGRGSSNGGRFYESSPGREAAIALEELGTDVFEPLVAILQAPDAVGRENAALALGMIESTRALDPLGVALRGDAVPEVRARAAWAMGMIESAQGVPDLAAALEDPTAEVREQAAWALGMIESGDGVAPLLEALGDPSEEVREQAAWGLGMIESRGAIEGLIPVLLDDPSPEVREQAAWALGMIEDPAAAEALMQALEDEDPEVQEEAMWALGMVMSQSDFEEIDRRALADAVRRMLQP
jgi:hypothetical protein